MTMDSSVTLSPERVEVARGLGGRPDELESEDQRQHGDRTRAVASPREDLADDAGRHDEGNERRCDDPDEISPRAELRSALMAVLPAVAEPLPDESGGAGRTALED